MSVVPWTNMHADKMANAIKHFVLIYWSYEETARE